jgi:hypothetical protein
MRGALGSSDKVIEIIVEAANTPEAIRGIRNILILAKILGTIEPEFVEGVARSLPGPLGGCASKTASISVGHHDGKVLADTQIASGRKLHKTRSCRFHSGSPEISKVALSTPIRRERPPARRMALSVMERSHAEYHCSKSRHATRHVLLGIRSRRGQMPGPSSNKAGIPPCRGDLPPES